MGKTCSVDGCGRAHYAKGFCSLHYERFLKYGNPHQVALKRKPNFTSDLCCVTGCTGPVFSKGMCRAHYEKTRKYGNPQAQGFSFVPRVVNGVHQCCSVDGCDSKIAAKGLCQAHYRRLRVYGDVNASAPVLTKNQRRRNKSQNGYVYLSWKGHPAAGKNGNLLEHRLVMYEKLGRVLLPGENIHHINGRRDDNSPENLELWVSIQPAGQRPKDLVAFAKEILARYEHLDM